MASVHLGRLVADRGFSRLVAVKMLSQDRAASSFYARALEDEARIASRVRHPNVVQPLDVVAERGDVLYVMEYVHGVALAQLLDTARTDTSKPCIPREVTVAVMLDVLSALHAAHEAKDETGRALGVVHRDVSPHNVLVGVDGLARLADFGVAKAMRREERTATGAVKGKPSYMAPEQQRGLPVTRQADVYAAGVVLAVALTGAAPAPAEPELAAEWLRAMIEQIDDRDFRDVVVTATKPQAKERYATAAEMAGVLSTVCARATAEAVGACVTDLAGDVLERRAELARRVESADANAEGDANANAHGDAHGDAGVDSDTNPIFKSAPAPAPALAPAPAPAPAPSRAPVRSSTPLFLFMFGVSIVIVIFFLRRNDTPQLPVPDPAPSPPATSAAPPPTETASVTPPPIPPAPSSALAPSPPPPRHKPLVTPTRARAPATEDRPAPPPPSPLTPRPDCDPAFRIDAQGRKHYKPECVP